MCANEIVSKEYIAKIKPEQLEALVKNGTFTKNADGTYTSNVPIGNPSAVKADNEVKGLAVESSAAKDTPAAQPQKVELAGNDVLQKQKYEQYKKEYAELYKKDPSILKTDIADVVYAKEKEQLREFGEAVVNYNPVKYINHEEIQGLTGEMYENGTELYKAIIETDIQQEEYVRDVYEATRADLDTMQDNIVQAKEDSDQAVEKGLEELKQIKHSNSVENQEILLDFSKKLPYTRLGSLEYRQAYEFMANPVGYRDIEDKVENVQPYVEDTVKQEKDSVSIKEYQEKDIEKIVTVIMSMICVIIVISTVKYHFHKKEEPYEV